MKYFATIASGAEGPLALGVDVTAGAVRTHSGRVITADGLVAEETFQAFAAAERSFRVDAARVGNASAIPAVLALVNVRATLPVGAGVIQADTLNGRAGETGRAGIAAEARHEVDATDARVARHGQIALQIRFHSIIIENKTKMANK